MAGKNTSVFPTTLEFHSLYFNPIRHSYNYTQVFTSINMIIIGTFAISSNINGEVQGSYLIWLRLDKSGLDDLQRNIKET